MDFYRVEQPDGTGPYFYHPDCAEDDPGFWDGDDSVIDAIPVSINISSRHPLPYNDGVEITDEEQCGFASKSALLAWFDIGPLLRRLEQAGFLVYRYDVESRRDGGHQSVAMIDALNPIAQWAPTEFDKALIKA